LTYFPNNSNAWQIENIPTPHPVTLYTTSSRKKKTCPSPSDHWETPGHSAGHWAISAICAACGATLNS
jgi:hypothetical protein